MYCFHLYTYLKYSPKGRYDPLDTPHAHATDLVLASPTFELL